MTQKEMTEAVVNELFDDLYKQLKNIASLISEQNEIMFAIVETLTPTQRLYIETKLGAHTPHFS